MLPSITIVTPSFNQNNYLGETIHSVVFQKYPNLEYIVMDGGSTDGSIKTIEQYSPYFAYWESQNDNGQYDAIQKGFDRSQGEIMGYLNSDDLHFPWTLRVVGEIFAAFPHLEWLTTSRPCATGANVSFPLEHTHYNWSHRWFLSSRGTKLSSRGFIQQEATFWRRSLWKKAGGYLKTDFHYAGDFELWSRFYLYAIPATVNIPLAMFRIHKEQKTAKKELYIAEAGKVISEHQYPIPLPSAFIRILNKIYQRTNGDSNWFGARCDRVSYDLLREKWIYLKMLEWSE